MDRRGHGIQRWPTTKKYNNNKKIIADEHKTRPTGIQALLYHRYWKESYQQGYTTATCSNKKGFHVQGRQRLQTRRVGGQYLQASKIDQQVGHFLLQLLHFLAGHAVNGVQSPAVHPRQPG